MDHAIWTEQRTLPSLLRDERGIPEQGNRTSEEVVQVLDGNLCLVSAVHWYGDRVLVRVGMAAESGQEVTYTAFCRKVAVEEAKASGIVREAWMLQIT